MEIVVPDTYVTISSAYAAAHHKDAILVKKGRYREDVVLLKAVSTLGEDRDSSIICSPGKIGIDCLEGEARVFRAVGESIVRSPHLEDSILKAVERQTDDLSLVHYIHKMDLVPQQTAPEDQRSLLPYIFEYPSTGDFRKEKEVSLSRFRLLEKHNDVKKLDNEKSRKSHDDLVGIISGIR